MPLASGSLGADTAVPDRTGVSLRSAAVLLVLALRGVASLLTSDLDLGVVADQVEVDPERLRLRVLIQPAALSLLAVVVGWRTSRPTGLGLPILEGGLARVTSRGRAAAGTAGRTRDLILVANVAAAAAIALPGA